MDCLKLFALSLYIALNGAIHKASGWFAPHQIFPLTHPVNICFAICLFHSDINKVGKATCALFFSWDLTTFFEVQPCEGGWEEAAEARQWQGQPLLP